ncbi:helix-hairpin-helix domain-containing protein [Streptomyces sp. NPDC020681]|uniref:helix-hairpin-helix domain-containing protein n=1 Tax=Streptomyces sp. NPDC020681 TaxID=3365083 RepID=UPI0037894491
MALRSRSATSGPGRAPASDGRARVGPARGGPTRVRSAHGGSTRGGPTARGGPTRVRGRRVAVASTAALHRRDALFVGPVGGAGTAVGPAPPVDSAGRGSADAGLAAGTGMRRRAGLAVRERLPLWMQLRCGLEPRTLAALAVVLVVAAVFAVQHFWAGRPQTVSAPQLVQQGAATSEPRPSPGPAPQPGAGPGARIVVDVSGKVRRPGVLQLPAGSRVADALRAAGGVKAGTDLTGLNRARVLMDGEQVVVGGPPGAHPAGSGNSGTAAGGLSSGGSGSGGAQAGPLSLNSATVEQLDTLPGVGPVLAQHIVDYRTQHGGFRSVDELREVNGIGDRRFADLQTLVRP